MNFIGGFDQFFYVIMLFFIGQMFQCPEGQSFWDKSKKCEKNRKIPMCNKLGPKLNWQTSLAPVLAD